MYPIEVCKQIIEKYIWEMKGVRVNILLPQTSSQVQKFELAMAVAFAYYGIVL
jgi:hypothetical protein